MFDDVKNMIFINHNKIVKFEIIFKVITILIVIPAFIDCFKLIMKITGYSYLTYENIDSFILNPIALVLLFLLLLVIGFYSIFYIGTMIILLDSAKQDKEIEIKDAITTSLKKSIEIFKPKNYGLLLFILLLIPFFNLDISETSKMSTIQVPEFIFDYIITHKILNLVCIVGILLLIYLYLRWIYSMHYYFLENMSFKDSHKASSKLSKKKNIKDFLKIILIQLILFAFYVTFLFVGIVIILLINKLLRGTNKLDYAVVGFMIVSLIIFSIIESLITYTIISILYYKHKEEKNEEVIHINIKEKENENTKNMEKLIQYILIFLMILGITTITYDATKSNLNLAGIANEKNIEVSAHRGASMNYPENTMSAFKGAKELGADWIELDVQQTKDNQIIVFHDSNFKRITGVNLNTWDATYDEIEKLDAGSFKNNEFKGEKIPLLIDVVKWAKENNMKLNIELKPTGYETDFEKQVIKIIKDNNFENDCVITSQYYDVLENVKKENKDITTVYVSSIALGDITKLDKADYFSIEETYITISMVSKIHNEGKKIFAWTVNTEEGINKMINLNVDNIITDDVTLCKKIINENKNNSSLFNETIKFLKSAFSIS